MWHTGGGGGDDGNSLGGTTNGGREGRRCVGAAVRAACWGVASQLTVTGGGRGDGVTMATVSAAKAKAMAQDRRLRWCRWSGRGGGSSRPLQPTSHYFSRADIVQEDNRNRQAAARLKVEQSLSHIVDIDVVTTLCPSGNNSITKSRSRYRPPPCIAVWTIFCLEVPVLGRELVKGLNV